MTFNKHKSALSLLYLAGKVTVPQKKTIYEQTRQF